MSTKPVVPLLAAILVLIVAGAAHADEKPVPPAAPEAAPEVTAPRLPPPSNFAKFEAQIKDTFKGYDASRLYIQVDRPLYRPGEVIWIQSYALTPGVGMAQGERFVRYELYNPRGGLVYAKYVEEEGGLANNDLLIPAGSPGGEYTLRIKGGDHEARRSIIVSAYTSPRIKKKLEFLRKSYDVGQRVHATIDVTAATGKKLIDTKLVALVQIDGREHTRLELKTDQSGAALVDFELHEAIREADGMLTILVEQGGLRESISRRIPFVHDDLEVKAYPEGGDLVAGLESRVYFEAYKSGGKPATVEGLVVDDTNRIVASASTYHGGMGRFTFTPEPNRSYRIEVFRPSQVKRSFSLPAPLTSGCVLKTFDDYDTTLEAIRVQVTCTSGQTVHLTARLHERIFDAASVPVEPGVPAIVHLTAREVSLGRAPGVARVSLFAENLQPVAERLVYRHRRTRLDIEVSADAGRYSPRDEVTLSIRTRTQAGEPVPAKLAVSVVDDTLLALADDKTANIMSRLYLEAELPQGVEEPNFYFDLQKPKAARGLDLVMGVRGYRRFEWTRTILTDTDGDLILDINDKCPNVAEDRDGFEDEDGCFDDQDDDGDGVPQSADVCPKQKGPAEFHGCPQMPPDADLDGVIGAADLCPTGPEDYDGFQDDDGCPDVDNDRDQIPDFEDECPNEPEIYNGFQDEDGCPEQRHVIISDDRPRRRPAPRLEALPAARALPRAPARDVQPPPAEGAEGAEVPVDIPAAAPDKPRVVITDSQIRILERVYFKPGSKRIHPHSFALLREVAAVLRSNPQITRIAIEGHTDHRGPERRNLRLSEKRAEAVMEYLINKGVERERLEIKGYGESRPILPTTDKRSRELNNRVEFNIVAIDHSYVRKPRATKARVFPTPSFKRPYKGPRQDFRDTIFWAPRVETDAKGQASLTFPLSDAITTFRVVTEGVGGAVVGRDEEVISSQLPFNMVTRIPPELSTGDILHLPISLENTTRAKATLDLEANLGELLTPVRGQRLPASVKLDPSASKTLFLPAVVTAKSGRGKITLGIDSGGFSDDAVREVVVTSIGFPQNTTISGVGLDGERHKETLHISGATAGSLEGTLRFMPSSASSLLISLRGMLRMPTGCFEQTSSANYPNILILQYLQSIGSADPELVTKVKGYLEAGYAKLVGYEVEGGGFEWWGKAPAHEALTAYGLLQFIDMSEVYPVDTALIARTARFLRSRRNGAGGFESAGRGLHSFGQTTLDTHDAYITYALSRTPRGILPIEIARQKKLAAATRDPYLLALATLTLHHTPGQAEHSHTHAKRLAGLQDQDGGFKGAATSIVNSSGFNLEVESTALAMLALIKVGGFDQEVRRAAGWLQVNRHHHGIWGSTQATVLALQALHAFAVRNPPTAKADGKATVRVNGQKLPSLVVPAEALRPLVFDLAPHLINGDNTVEVELDGADKLPYTIGARYTTARPISSDDAKLKLSAKLERGALALGETVRLTARVENTTKATVTNPLVVIGIPAGLGFQEWQLEELRKEGRVGYIETRPREVILYYRAMAAGAVEDIALDLVALVPGTFQGPASRAYLYYDNLKKSWAAPIDVKITP